MKKLLIVILLVPTYSLAQSEFLGKYRNYIQAELKIANIAFINCNCWYGANYSDSFKISGEKLICVYNKRKRCIEVIKMMKLSLRDSVKAQFNVNYDKKEGETFSEDIWADKSKTFKVHLCTNLGGMYLDYLRYNDSYIIY